jgi:hypothetical protein
MGNIPLHATVMPEMTGDRETCFLADGLAPRLTGWRPLPIIPCYS